LIIIGIVCSIAIISSLFILTSSIYAFERYSVEIHKSQEKYFVGENLDFYLVIHGNGYECGNLNVKITNHNGLVSEMNTKPICEENQRIKEFYKDFSENSETFGALLPESGKYDISVQYEPAGFWVTDSFVVDDPLS